MTERASAENILRATDQAEVRLNDDVRSVCELAYMTIRRVVVIRGNDLSRVCPATDPETMGV